MTGGGRGWRERERKIECGANTERGRKLVGREGARRPKIEGKRKVKRFESKKFSRTCV